MANRFARRRVDGIFAYSDSLEEIQRSAIQEEEEYLKEVLGFIGFVLGAMMMCAVTTRNLGDCPKVLRFASIVAGACSCGIIGACSAALVRKLLPVCWTLGVVGGVSWLLWRVLG